MKPRNTTLFILQQYTACIAVAFILLLVVSWLSSIYIDGVKGLLTPKGLRWMCSNITTNFATVPLAHILLGFMSAGVLRESGILKSFHGHLSLKQKRALQITAISAAIILLVLILLLFLPDAVLLSAFGTIENSSFTKGLYGLTACILTAVGTIYGYTSGKFMRTKDIIHSYTKFFPFVAYYFAMLFIASQFVCCLEFTEIPYLFSNGNTILSAVSNLLYYSPLAIYVFSTIRN